MRALSSANGIAVAVGAAMFSMFFFLSLYMQDVLHYSALKTGFAFRARRALHHRRRARRRRSWSARSARAGCCSSAARCRRSRCGGCRGCRRSGNYFAHVLPPLLMVVSSAWASRIVPMTVAATSGVDRSEAGLASGLLTPPGRSAARSGSRCLRRSRPTAAATCSARSVRRRPRSNRARVDARASTARSSSAASSRSSAACWPYAAEPSCTRGGGRAKRARPRPVRTGPTGHGRVVVPEAATRAAF